MRLHILQILYTFGNLSILLDTFFGRGHHPQQVSNATTVAHRIKKKRNSFDQHFYHSFYKKKQIKAFLLKQKKNTNSIHIYRKIEMRTQFYQVGIF